MVAQAQVDFNDSARVEVFGRHRQIISPAANQDLR
jgi:hypothetical protein